MHTNAPSTKDEALVVLVCEDVEGLEAVNSLPSSYAEYATGTNLPITYFMISDTDNPTKMTWKKPLAEEERTEWAHDVLSHGTSVLNSLSLPPILKLLPKGVAKMHTDGRPRAGASRPVLRDVPVASIPLSELTRKLEGVGTTEEEQRKSIVETAKDISPAFKENIENEESASGEEAPWETPLWKKVVEAVPVSEVYSTYNEHIYPSETERFKCLLGHDSIDGKDVICKDDRHWECLTCGASGNSFQLFHKRKGARDKDGKSLWVNNSREFSKLAGRELSEEWCKFIKEHEQTRNSQRSEDRENAIMRGQARLHEMNETFFVAPYNGKTYVIEEITDLHGNCELVPHAAQHFRTLYDNEKIAYLNSKGELKSTSLGTYWLYWEGRRSYESVVFYPDELPENHHRKLYNLWRGFEVEPREGDFSKTEYHLKHVWCNGNEEHYNYLLMWFAHLLQYPTEKPGVALVIKGDKGTGKSTILEGIFEHILGRAYATVDLGEQATGKFNHHLRGKLLLVLEEAIWAGSKSDEGRVKNMITGPRARYEPKGVDSFEEQSYMRLVFISNEKRAVPASLGERRYFALKVTSTKQCDISYFKELRHEFDNGGREAFMHHLMSFPVDKDAIRLPPRAPALWDDIYEGLPLVEKWLYDGLNTSAEEIDDPEREFLWGGGHVPTRLFYQDFDKYRAERERMRGYAGYNGITSVKKMTQFLKSFFGESHYTTHKRQRCYFVASLEWARGIFESHVERCEVPWDDFQATSDYDEEIEHAGHLRGSEVVADDVFPEGSKHKNLKEILASNITRFKREKPSGEKCYISFDDPFFDEERRPTPEESFDPFFEEEMQPAPDESHDPFFEEERRPAPVEEIPAFFEDELSPEKSQHFSINSNDWFFQDEIAAAQADD